MLPAISSYPTVTVAIPAYNEATFIGKVVKGFLESSYSNLIEILVADGGSQDETVEVVNNISILDSRVKLLHNPRRIQSAALNLMLSEARGEIFLRADAHCEYASDYVEQCVNALKGSKALNVGGSQRYVAETPFQAGVALASRSFLNGGAKYRDPEYNGHADTVYLGCFLKEALIKIAENHNGEAFDTSQVTNQDAELNLKLIELDPKAIYVSSKIKVWYFPRKEWTALCKQFFKYGRGRYLTSTKHVKKAPIRSKLPFLFLFSLILLWFIDLLIFQGSLYITGIILACLIIPIVEGLRIILKFRNTFEQEFWRGTKDNVPSLANRLYFCIVALFSMPITYACGYAYQIVKHRIFKIEGW